MNSELGKCVHDNKYIISETFSVYFRVKNIIGCSMVFSWFSGADCRAEQSANLLKCNISKVC